MELGMITRGSERSRPITWQKGKKRKDQSKEETHHSDRYYKRHTTQPSVQAQQGIPALELPVCRLTIYLRLQRNISKLIYADKKNKTLVSDLVCHACQQKSMGCSAAFSSSRRFFLESLVSLTVLSTSCRLSPPSLFPCHRRLLPAQCMIRFSKKITHKSQRWVLLGAGQGA